MSDNRTGDTGRQLPDYDLVEHVVADTPARLKALGHPVRSLIVDLVLERAMTVTELAELIGKPRGSLAHHVDVLVSAGLLQVVRTRRVRAIEERFYGRTARTIVFPDDATAPGDLPFVADARREYDLAAAEVGPGGFTYRHARIPSELAAEFTERVMALALEFAQLPRGGDREYGFLVGVFPTNRLPSRGGSPADDTKDDTHEGTREGTARRRRPAAPSRTDAAEPTTKRSRRSTDGATGATGASAAASANGRTSPRASVRTAPASKERT